MSKGATNDSQIKHMMEPCVIPIRRGADFALLQAELEGLFEFMSPIGALQGVRKIRKGRPGSCVSFFPSRKNGALMPCESRLEKQHCLLLEHEPNVVGYRTQPLTLTIGAAQRYTPDVAVRYTDGIIELREVKPAGALQDPDLVKFYRQVGDLLASREIPFNVVTDEYICAEPRLHNLSCIYRVFPVPFNAAMIDFGLATLNQLDGPVSMHNFRNALVKGGLEPHLAERLLLEGRLGYDHNLPLGPNSFVWGV